MRLYRNFNAYTFGHCVIFSGKKNPPPPPSPKSECARAHAVIIPNRILLIRFGGISGEFGRPIVRILARTNGPEMPLKIDTIKYLPYSNSAQNPVIFLIVTVLKSVRRPIMWPARRIIRVNKRRKK